jgi:hypothetical protein
MTLRFISKTSSLAASLARGKSFVSSENGCVLGLTLKHGGMVKVARKIRLEDEGKDVGHWSSRSPEDRLRALDGMRRMYIKASVAPGKQRLPRVYRIVKLKCG